MTKQTWIIACALSALVVLGILGLMGFQQKKELEEAQAELTRLKQETEQVGSETAALKQELEASKTQIEALRAEKEAATQAQKNLETQMRDALQTKDVTISELQGKLTVEILDRILFDSGEAVLKPEGEQMLQKIALILSQFPGRKIHIIGHTDNVPIRASLMNRFASNWELSTARALAAVRFLTEKAGVEPQRLGAVGYGEFQPIADNSTAEGRAKNRRIALVVLPEEFPALDILPSELMTTGTNAPPAQEDVVSLKVNDLSEDPPPAISPEPVEDTDKQEAP